MFKKSLLTTGILFLGLAAGLRSQEPVTATPSVSASSSLAGIAHIALRVQNLDASVAFYEELGFAKAFALSRDGAVYEAFIKINDRQFIELYPATAKDPKAGFLHVCFEGNSLQAVHDYYVAQGLKPTDVRKAGAGNLLFTMMGPETPNGAQNLEYTQYLPGSLHSKDAGQHLGENRVADKIVSADVSFNDPAAAAAFYAEKLGFKSFKPGAPVIGSVYGIPGSADESIRIESDRIGPLARITLSSRAMPTNDALRARGVPFMNQKGRIVFTDPDRNEIILEKK